jgi:peptide/nickel transport system permease protein
MQTYILRRLTFSLPALLLTSLIVFTLMHIIPGDVIVAKLADQGTVRKADIDLMKHQYGLDKPLYQQYGIWLGRILRGDLGHSILTSEPINESLMRALPITIELALLSLLVGILLGVSLGIISAVSRNTPGDYVSRIVAIVGLSAPDFWLATLLITFFAIWFRWSPPLKSHPLLSDPISNIGQFILPALIVGYRFSCTIMRITRSSLLEVLREDYIRTASAKGMRQQSVIFRHALKNAFLPVITIIGGQLAVLLGGLAIIEQIFALPGLGRLALQGLTFRDYPLVQADVMLFATMVILINLVVDVSYGWLDPRIRYR